MGRFAELLVKEYPSIAKRNSPTKDSCYRIRVVKRKNQDGILVSLVDIRKFIVNEKRAIFTEEGIYLDRNDLGSLIDILQDIRKEHFQKG